MGIITRECSKIKILSAILWYDTWGGRPSLGMKPGEADLRRVWYSVKEAFSGYDSRLNRPGEKRPSPGMIPCEAFRVPAEGNWQIWKLQALIKVILSQDFCFLLNPVINNGNHVFTSSFFCIFKKISFARYDTLRSALSNSDRSAN